MFRRRELLDLKNPEDYRFAITFLHDSYVGPENTFVEFLYHQEFGFPEPCKRAEVIELADMQIKDFKEKLEAVPDNVKTFTMRYPTAFPFQELRAVRKTR